MCKCIMFLIVILSLLNHHLASLHQPLSDYTPYAEIAGCLSFLPLGWNLSQTSCVTFSPHPQVLACLLMSFSDSKYNVCIKTSAYCI